MVPAALLLLADARFPTGAHAHSGGIEAAHAQGDVRDLRTLELFIRGRLATTALVEAAFAAAATRVATDTSLAANRGPSHLEDRPNGHGSQAAPATNRGPTHLDGRETGHGSRDAPDITNRGPSHLQDRANGHGSQEAPDTANRGPSHLDGRETGHGSAGTRTGAGWATLDRELAARIPSPRLRATSRTLGRQLLRAGERAWPSALYAELRLANAEDPMQPIALGAVAAAAGLTPEDAALCALHHQIGTWTTGAVRLIGLDPFAVHALAARLAPDLEAAAAAAAVQAAGPARDLPSTSSPLADILAEHHATWEVRLFAS